MMSKNQKYQKNIEQICLDFVKNDMNEKDCFGLSNKQYIKLREKLSESKSNLNNNKFPDFIFSNGFIEHFAVTSSLEDKKGAKQKRESIVFENKSKKRFLSEQKSNENEKTLFSRSYSREFEEHSHLHVINSIKKNWIKHIESYNKNISTPKKGVFLIEYTDINVQTAISRGNGPLEIFDTYRISVDEQMLDWIYIYKEKIDYLIFVNRISSSIEVIRIDKIPELIEKIPEVRFASIVGMEAHEYVRITAKNEDFQ